MTNATESRETVLAAIHKVSKGQTTVSVEQAGQLLGIGKASAYAAARTGRLKTIKMSDRKWRVPVAALEKLLLAD